MEYDSDDVFWEMYSFAERLGFDRDEADRIARHVMHEHGPIDAAAAAPGSVGRAKMFKAVAAIANARSR